MSPLMMRITAFVAMVYFMIAAKAESFSLDYATGDDVFVVPLGVFSVDLAVEGAAGAFSGYAMSGTLAVSPNQALYIHVGGASATCGGEASYVHDGAGNYWLLGAGGHTNSGSSFTRINTNGGEGVDGECGGLSTHDASVSAVIGSFGSGNSAVSIGWDANCDEQFDLLHSDYDPTLLSTSSLYIENDVALLRLDIALPNYYYDVVFDYMGSCPVGPVVVEEQVGCYNYFHTSIDYADQPCDFDYDSTFASDTGLFSGSMRVNASLDLTLSSSWDVVRELSAPINWFVELQNLISVSSDVQIINPDICETDADCNNNGCCEEGLCNCDCDALENGYAGTFCEGDIEPPVCVNVPVTVSADSPRGGCVLGADLFDALPSISDNAGALSEYIRFIVSDESTFNLLANSDDLMDVCFFPGSHSIVYSGTDAEGLSASCPITVTVTDISGPIVDCAGCQDANEEAENGNIDICIGNANYGAYTKTNVAVADLKTYMSLDASDDIHLPQFPGQLIDATIDYGTGHLVGTDASIYLDCDCTFDATVSALNIADEHGGHVTNQWDSWSLPSAYDVADGTLAAAGDADPEADGYYDVANTVTDSDGFSATCNIAVLYDLTPPSCDDWFFQVDADPANSNYSLPVAFPTEAPNLNVDISGLFSAVLSPARVQDDIYRVGYLEQLDVVSTWQLIDNAGNFGDCEWRVQVDNPDPCVYPVCGDQPPINTQCPADIVVFCSSTEGCGGCINWDEPTWFDDAGIVQIDASHDSGDIFVLGTTQVTYRASDARHIATGNSHVAGHFADCNFTVTITDVTPPEFQSSSDGYYYGPSSSGSYVSAVDFTTCGSSLLIELSDSDEADYSYDLLALDSCPLNLDVTYTTDGFPTAASLDIDGTPADNVVLGMGVHTFTYIATDSSGNFGTCQWQVEVIDTGAPYPICPANIERMIHSANATTTIVNYDAMMGEDVVDGLVFGVWDIPSGSAFPIGETVVTGTVSDAAGNTDTCSFIVTVTAPYPAFGVDAVLTEARVYEMSPDVFGAYLEFMTRSTPYHRLINGQSMTAASLSDPVEGVADCALDGTKCFQTWRVTVQFSSCALVEEPYLFNFESDCLPDDCIYANQFPSVTITLTADNYCWQSLADVVISATLTMHTQAVHDQYIIDYDAGLSPAANTPDYLATQTFYNNQNIAGIIEVTSESVFTSDITCVEADKESFSDSEFSTLVGTDALVNAGANEAGVSSLNRASAATFYYNENSIPIDTTYWVRYTATVEVSYDLGVRRRLLNLEFDAEGRQLLQASETQDEAAEATAIVLDGPITDVEDARDGSVLLAARSCADAVQLQEAMPHVIGSFLHIAESRIQATVQQYTDSLCFVQIVIKHSDCDDLVAISDLLDDLDLGVTEINGDFHDKVAEHADIPTATYFDRDVFFIVQSPEETAGETYTIEEDATTVGKEAFDTMNIVYALIFLLIGAVGATIVHKMTKMQQEKEISKIGSPMLDGGRTLRRSSVATNDVQITV